MAAGTKQLHNLKHTGPENVLFELKQLEQQHPNLETISKNLAYLEKRVDHIVKREMKRVRNLSDLYHRR